MSRNRRQIKPALEEPTVNLTPLIDVVFVLLIGFITIAPLLHLDKVELAPAPTHKGAHNIAVQEMSPIAVHVHADDSIWLHGNLVSIADLPTQLNHERSLYPQATPQLFHDKQGHFGTYQEVKNALEAAGFEKVEVVLQ